MALPLWVISITEDYLKRPNGNYITLVKQVSGALAFTINFHYICICPELGENLTFHLQNFLGWKFGLDHCMTHTKDKSLTRIQNS